MKIAARPLVLGLVGFVAQPVLAQSATSADETVEARANIIASDLQLAIAAQANLDFGTVTLPNTSNPNVMCRYEVAVQIAGGGVESPTSVTEIENGNVVETVAPTTSGCRAEGSNTPATFVVTCTPAAQVNFQVTVQSDGSVFLAPSSFAVVTTVNGSGARQILMNDLQNQFTCPDGSSAATSPAGGFVLRTGARFELNNANTPFNGQIGTVTMTAMY